MRAVVWSQLRMNFACDLLKDGWHEHTAPGQQPRTLCLSQNKVSVK